MDNLDKQLYHFKDRLMEDVGVDQKHLSSICTTIYDELNQLTTENLFTIESASRVSLKLRIEELEAFNLMMVRANNQLNKYAGKNDSVIKIHLIQTHKVQIYF